MGVIYGLLLEEVIDSARLAVVVQVVPRHLRVLPAAGFQREIFVIDLRQFTSNAVLDRHADRIGWTRVDLDLAHAGEISVDPLVEGMQSRAAGAAAVKAVDSPGFRVQFWGRNLVVLWDALELPMLFAPNPEVIVIGLVPPKVSAGEVRVAIEVGVYDAPVQEDIRGRRDGLKGLVHGVRVPDGEAHSGAAVLDGGLRVQLRRH